ncbi:hypothetical protein, partial [Synoicihabitans lomoniglobus]|uniref:hypothetical protein n=1 Tax=Synoicihabitans lomoniglobus TaxID=2909285 RepID=UPI002ED37A9D|nr:hypothetical protein [Opitutaceae bacterium LMO-M01]
HSTASLAIGGPKYIVNRRASRTSYPSLLTAPRSGFVHQTAAANDRQLRWQSRLSSDVLQVRGRRVLLACAVSAGQIVLFYVLWWLALTIARHLGRFPPTWFGQLPFIVGFWMFVIVSLLSCVTSVLQSRRAIRLSVTILCFVAWMSLLILMQNLDERPFAIPTFVLIAGTVLFSGSHLLLPRLIPKDEKTEQNQPLQRTATSRRL